MLGGEHAGGGLGERIGQRGGVLAVYLPAADKRKRGQQHNGKGGEAGHAHHQRIAAINSGWRAYSAATNNAAQIIRRVLGAHSRCFIMAPSALRARRARRHDSSVRVRRMRRANPGQTGVKFKHALENIAGVSQMPPARPYESCWARTSSSAGTKTATQNEMRPPCHLSVS